MQRTNAVRRAMGRGLGRTARDRSGLGHARDALGRARAGGRAEMHVHFHSGPDSQPVPCFDPGCPYPRLTVPGAPG
jgi:hypothetical protein